MKIRILLPTFLLCFCSTGSIWGQGDGQSLGDMARKQRERKQAQSGQTTVITNEGAEPQQPAPEAPPGTSQTTPISIPRGRSGLVDCGANFSCFMQALENGKPAKTRQARTSVFSGFKYADTAFMEVGGFTPETTTYYLKLANRSVEFTAEFSKRASEAGAGQKEIEDAKKHILADMLPEVDLEQACTFQRGVLKGLLQTWSSNGFSIGGFDKAEKCEVSVASEGAPAAAAKGAPAPGLGATDAWCAANLEKEQNESAVQVCEGGLQGNPNSFSRLNNLAWFYATAKDTRLRNPAKALEYARKGVSLSHEKIPQILDTLAEAYYANGNYDQAVETETKALSLDPTSRALKESLARYQRAKETKKRESSK